MFCKFIRFASACVICNRFKMRNIAQTTKSNANSVPEHCLDQVSSDYGGPFPKSAEGYQYVCIFFDIKSHYMVLYPCKSTGANELCENLLDYTCKFGKPREFLTDRGTQYTSDTLKTFSKMFGIDQSMIMTANSRGNSFAENSVKMIKKALSVFAGKEPTEWPRFFKFNHVYS